MLGGRACRCAPLGSARLETAAFTFFLLLGFEFTFASQRPRRAALSGWRSPSPAFCARTGCCIRCWRWRSSPGARSVGGRSASSCPRGSCSSRRCSCSGCCTTAGCSRIRTTRSPAARELGSRDPVRPHVLPVVLRAGGRLVAALPLAFAWRRRAQSSVTAASAGGDPFPALLFAWVAAATTLLYVVRSAAISCSGASSCRRRRSCCSSSSGWCTGCPGSGCGSWRRRPSSGSWSQVGW